jgi:hypothetical protein
MSGTRMMSVMMKCVGLCDPSGGKEQVVLRNYVGFVEGELPVEDIEKLPFYAADIALSEQSCPRCPIGILR